jgi:predicted nucleic acid-binding protein
MSVASKQAGKRRLARIIVDNYSAWSIRTTPADITAAFRLEDQSKLLFWDALICASAAKAGANPPAFRRY